MWVRAGPARPQVGGYSNRLERVHIMILNRVEFVLMNNPIRAWIQRHFEASRLLRMGGMVEGGLALEIGCGQHRVARQFLRHPEFDRFGADEFQQALTEAGLVPERPKVFRDSFGWFTAIKPN
jgi:hypothetical protein